MAGTFWNSEDVTSAAADFWSVGGSALSDTNLGSSLDKLDNTFAGFQQTSDDLQTWSDNFDWDKTDYTLAEKAEGY